MDRFATFTDLTKRNALRKAAGLPLLDLRSELDHAVALAAQQVFRDLCEAHQTDRDRIKADVLADLRATRDDDFPQTSMGWMLVNRLTDQRFRAFLEVQHGIKAPPMSTRNAVHYG